jgi:hypothetical protein
MNLRRKEPVVSDFPSKLNRLPLYHAYCGGRLKANGDIHEYADSTVVDVKCEKCLAFVCYLDVRKPQLGEADPR